MKKLIAIVGLCGAGKSVATEFFENKGFLKIRFGQITIDELNNNGLEINEKNERQVREQLRAKHGMAAYAILSIPKIEKALIENDVVIDGLYSWSEYKVLKEKFNDLLKVICVFTPPKIRYHRLSIRKERPLTFEESKSRDYAEIENIEKAGPIAMADFLLDNSLAVDVMNTKLENLYSSELFALNTTL